MVSSRRLAREWALKILYQIDVGKPPPQEALDAALEQLRMEFVHRGSRTASGSPAEELCLNAVTQELRDTLPTLRPPFERAVTTALARLTADIPYWQERAFETLHSQPDTAFPDRRRRSKAAIQERLRLERVAAIPLTPPRLLSPQPDAVFFPPTGSAADGLQAHIAALTAEEQRRYTQYIQWGRATLPTLLSPLLERTARQFALHLADEVPMEASPAEKKEFLQERRESFNRAAVEHWQKVGAMAQKQTGDWLRTAAFVHKLVTGVQAHQEETDRSISGLAAGWRMERQVAVDRNILRLAAFEMLFLPGIPTGASINEAVELAKKYSTAESGRFVNGVLGALAVSVGDKAVPPEENIEDAEPDGGVDVPDIADLDEPPEA